MESKISSILSLNPENVKQILSDVAGADDSPLFEKLLLTQIRRNVVKLLTTNSPANIMKASELVYKNMSKLCTAIDELDNKSLKNEILVLFNSLLVNRFTDGLAEFEEMSIDEFRINVFSKFSALSICGLEKTLRKILLNKIAALCKETIDGYDGVFEESALEAAMNVLSTKVAQFRDKFPELDEQLPKLKMIVYNDIVDFRSKQIFDIVTSFPDSKPALLDLREACTQSKSHKKVAATAVQIFCTRLLHLGAGTSDIVTQYINAIQALNIVDESGGLTRAISPPIQNYLTTRSDLLTTIVSQIISDQSLMDSNDSGISAKKPNDDDINREAKEQRELDENWNPEPLHSHIRDLNSLIRDASDSDALALLLNVYGSISSFVSQLEKEIARRLITTPGYMFDNEIRAIELLKKRFGSQIFLNCEVILQDILDSKRLQRNMEPTFLQPLVISHMYWPEISGCDFNMPECVRDEIKHFEEEFTTIKTQRKLKWIDSVGIVEMDVDFEDGQTMSVNASPICATMLTLFNEFDSIDVPLVCEKLSISKRVAENAFSFWVSNNVLIKSGDRYTMSPTKPAASVETIPDDGLSPPQKDEEVDDETLMKEKAEKFKPHAINVLQARPKEQFTIDSFYSFFVRFVRGVDFKINKDDFVKLIPLWEQEGWLQVNGENIKLIRN